MDAWDELKELLTKCIADADKGTVATKSISQITDEEIVGTVQ